MKTISRYIMTLALLLTAVGGAWAQSTLNVVKLEVPAEWATDFNPLTAADLPGFKTSTLDEAKAWTGAPAEGNSILIYSFADNKTNLVNFPNGNVGSNGQASFTKDLISGINAKFYYTAEPAEPEPADEPADDAIDVKWDAATKTGTFVMPAFDVEIAPIYAPTAQWAKVENVDQLPTAAEGIYAESNDSIVTPGTVAKIGETENPQGIVMYAVTSTNQATAPALDAFSATLPTAKDITAAGDVLVWYYIKGADTPDGQEATAENTFNDSEICETPLTVTVLNNKFDIQFNAANDNTIEAGKATVKVGETAAEVKEGKLTGVKMNSKVTVTAKEGYKFRKVEVKKKGDGPLAAAFKDGAKFKVGYQWNFGYTTYLEFTNSGGTYSLTSVSGLNEANGFNSSTLTVKNGNVLALDVVCQPNGDRMDEFCAQIEFDATSSTYKYSSKGANFTGIISVSVNDTDITSQLTEAK